MIRFLSARWRGTKIGQHVTASRWGADIVGTRPVLFAALASAALDRLALMAFSRHAPAEPTSHRSISVAIGTGPDFYLLPWQAALHFVLTCFCFACVVLLILRVRTRR